MIKVPDRDSIPFHARLAAADLADGREVVWQPALDDYQPPDPEGDEDLDRLWGMRPAFTHLHQYARSRRVAPWAVLANVLARVLAATPPNVQLPPIIGSHASLNLFVGLVGPSGSGKDSSRGVAKEAVTHDYTAGARTFLEAPLGSGEGLAHMFMRLEKPRDDNGKLIRGAEPMLVQYNDAALVVVSEIDSMGAIAARQASTLMAQLRQAAMGEQLGFFYVATDKRMIVPEHAYRLCLVAGVQPLRAAALLDDADGGTPQRFLWMPVQDRDAPDVRPPTPQALLWQPPTWPHGLAEVKVCDTAVTTIEEAHLGRTRGDGDALDGHALLTRLKVAAALSIFDARTAVDDSDWELAGIVMEMSTLTRLSVQRTLADHERQRSAAAAEAEASKQIIVRERGDAATMRRVTGVIRRALGRLGDDEWITHGRLSQKVAGRDKEYFDVCLSGLVDTGEVVEETYEYHGTDTTRYRPHG